MSASESATPRPIAPQAPAATIGQAAPRPLRVLLVTARYLPLAGGVELHTYEVARRLAAGGHDVTVLTTDLTGRLPAEERHDGVQVRRTPAWPARGDYYLAPGVYRTMLGGRWDVAHCQGYHTLVAPLAMLAAHRAGLPYVVTFHSGGHSSRLRTALRPAQRALLRPLLARAARLIGVSEFEAAFFRTHLRLPAERFVVIPNGAAAAPTPAPAPPDAAEPLIVSVGRLERYKGHHRVIAALPAVLDRCPGARLRIVGAGPYQSELCRLARRLGVDDRVEIGATPPGDRQGMATLLARAALVTLLSEYEAHPLAVMEALALRRPVLVADSSGLRELAERGLVRAIPLRSSAAEVAAAVLEQLRAPLAPPAVSLPTWEECAAALVEVYQDAAGEARCAS
jgi:glycosyltransferase involved in cell wall biosynthesis